MKDSQSGFTLVEAAAVIGILSIIIGAVLVLLEAGVRTERGQEARTRALDELRLAMNRTTKDVRQALSVKTTSTTSSLDMQTLINGVERRIVFDVAGQTLRRSVDGGTPVPLADRLTSAVIFCYDPPVCTQANPATTRPALVRVSMTVRPQGGAKPLSLGVDVRLRNSGGS